MYSVFAKTKQINNSGFVSIIMMMGLITIGTMGLLSSFYQKRDEQKNSENKLSIHMLQQNYSLYIQDDEAWKKTVTDSRNTSFACLFNGTACEKESHPIVVLRNAKNEIVVDSDVNKGVKSDGTVCTGFQDSSTPKELLKASDCNFRVEVSWQPVCKTACANPKVIQVSIAISKSMLLANSARFIASNASAAGVNRKPLPMPTVTAIGVSYGMTIALAEGNAYCWGSSWDGRCGGSSTGGNFLTPRKVTGIPPGITRIDVGQASACAIQGGNVYCWGTGYGSTPRKIDVNYGGPLNDVIDVAVGFGHACAITTNQSAYCWGSNGSGQLGFVSPAGIDFPTDYGTWSGPNGPAFPVYGLSRGANGPDNGPVTSIAAGLNSTCAIVGGGVKCWGSNESRGGYNSLAAPPFYSLGYRPITTSPYGSTAKGYKVCWPGIHKGDALPLVYDPFSASGYFSATGVAEVDSQFCNPIPQQPDDTASVIFDTNFKQIVMAYGAICALKNDGSLVCWAYYNYGRCTTPSTGSACQPTTVTAIAGVEKLGRHKSGFFALKSGKLYAWGNNSIYNPLGDPAGGWLAPYWGSVWQPFEITGLPSGAVTNFQGGAIDDGNHNCAVAAGKAYCWGRNNYGQLGDGTTTDKVSGNPVMVVDWP